MENITIPMEEYKELLIIKGKYEELKSNQKPPILYRGIEKEILPCREITTNPLPKEPYKITCQRGDNKC